MADFTAWSHPVLAVACPSCGRRVGVMCRRPSGHKAADFHARRKADADRHFVDRHGADASIERTVDGWRIDPQGRLLSCASPVVLAPARLKLPIARRPLVIPRIGWCLPFPRG